MISFRQAQGLVVLNLTGFGNLSGLGSCTLDRLPFDKLPIDKLPIDKLPFDTGSGAALRQAQWA